MEVWGAKSEEGNLDRDSMRGSRSVEGSLSRDSGRKSNSGEGSLGRDSKRAIPALNLHYANVSGSQSQGGSGEGSPSGSDDVVGSAERGLVLEDLQLAIAAINHPENQEYWTNVVALSQKRLDDVATYANVMHGQTALHCAARWGVFHMVELLLKHGAGQFVDEIGYDPHGNPDDSPLTYAVRYYCEYSNQALILILLEHSQNREDALCTAIQCYEKAEEPSKRAKYKELLEWLLTLPEIIGSKKKLNYPATGSLIQSCINKPDHLTGYRALQLLCIFRDKEYFNKLNAILPKPDAGEKEEHYQLDKKTDDNLLHLAVLNARKDNEKDAAFVGHLAGLFSDLGSQLNNTMQTPLSIACEAADRNLIIALANNNVKLLPPQSSGFQGYLTPLHVALRDAQVDVLDLLLEKWPVEANVLLQHATECDALLKLAMDSWRSKVLLGENDKSQVDVLKKLLKFDSTGRILDRQLKKTTTTIKQINDTDLRTPLLKMHAKICSDYQLISHANDDAAIAQKIKILGLANALQQVSEVYSSRLSDASAKEMAQKHFIQCCRHLLFSNALKTYFGIAVCAFLGFLVGALLGYIVGTLLTGGGPGGLVLGPPSAEYGLTLGTILGCAIFGIGAGVGRYAFSDLCKWHLGLWASTRAMNKNIKEVRPIMEHPLLSHVEMNSANNDFHPDESSESLNTVYTQLN